MERPKLEDFKRPVYDGQDYADWYEDYYKALEKYCNYLSSQDNLNVNNCSRCEVIDNTGRVYTNYKCNHIELQVQDKERTLKIFIS